MKRNAKQKRANVLAVIDRWSRENYDLSQDLVDLVDFGAMKPVRRREVWKKILASCSSATLQALDNKADADAESLDELLAERSLRAAVRRRFDVSDDDADQLILKLRKELHTKQPASTEVH